MPGTATAFPLRLCLLYKAARAGVVRHARLPQQMLDMKNPASRGARRGWA